MKRLSRSNKIGEESVFSLQQDTPQIIHVQEEEPQTASPGDFNIGGYASANAFTIDFDDESLLKNALAGTSTHLDGLVVAKYIYKFFFLHLSN